MSVIDQVIGTDRVWDALSGCLMGRAKRARDGYTLNCPMCVSRGETMDKRSRCRVYHDAQGIGVHCYNCAFKTRFQVGGKLSRGMMAFLRGCGVGQHDVMRLDLWALTVANMVEARPALQDAIPLGTPSFPAKPLPAGSRSLTQWAEQGCDDPHYLAAVDYVLSRGDDLAVAIDYYWCPSTENDINQRVIIPCLFDGTIVGWTGRAVGPVTPRYFNQTPPNFLFNADVLRRTERRHVILVEGIFDALAVDGVATIGARIADRQIAWLNGLDATKIVVPDRDLAGLRMIDIALKHGWRVSFPALPSPGAEHRRWWEDDIKDCADACQRYGQLWTLRSVLASATDNRMHINMLRPLFV